MADSTSYPVHLITRLLGAIDVLETEWKRVVARDDHLSVSAMRVGVRGVLRARDELYEARPPETAESGRVWTGLVVVLALAALVVLFMWAFASSGARP